MVVSNPLLYNRRPSESSARPVSKIEVMLVVTLLISFSGGLSVFPLLDKALAALSYVITFGLILQDWRRFLYFSIQDLSLFLLVAYACVSVVWSAHPASTLVNARGLLRLTAFGIYFAMRYPLKEQVRLLLWAFGLLACMSFLFGFIDPSKGISAADWEGTFPQKNFLGRMMVFSAVTFLVALLDKPENRRLLFSGFLLSALLIFLSNAKTALVHIIFLIVVLLPICNLLRSSLKINLKVSILSFIAPAALSISYWFISNYESIALELFDKENSLGGRSDLQFVLRDIFFWEKPWFGHGYFGFWRANHDRVIAAVDRIQTHHGRPWVPTHAHNGFLELALALGIVGIAIFAINYIHNFWMTIRYVDSEKTALSLFPFLFMTFFLTYNINNAMSILTSENLLWPLYVSVAIRLKYWNLKGIA